MAFLRIKQSGSKKYLYRVSTHRENGKVKQKQEYLHPASDEDIANVKNKNIDDIEFIRFDTQNYVDLCDLVWKCYQARNMQYLSISIRNFETLTKKYLAENLWNRVAFMKKEIDAQGACFLSIKEIGEMNFMAQRIDEKELAGWLEEICNNSMDSNYCVAPWKRK